MRRIRSPTFIDPSNIDPTGTNPKIGGRPPAVSPADARQPQLLQSGAPPNWHGVIFVVKSADTVIVVRAKTHSSGDCGGAAYASISPCGIFSFGYRSRNAIRSATTRS